MVAIIREMEDSNTCWNITIASIILLSYLKMKDFTRLMFFLSKFPERCVEPDMVTFGILFDAEDMGSDGKECLQMWRKMGLLYKRVEMNTDPLALSASGKGGFPRSCEEACSSLETNARENKRRTYVDFINLV
ncbi:hypothetical protein NC653_033495 [Populus alba x Populus x berolinensis]|uniref:Pentatricopeptide repeat-containing protein n=1 Tax=Populus alba x Populus x berolinensis TaxID=444605 RepID=A0AAD6PZ64_9ROSI|nr:hypothetical protein NC653_033495 [Populus alba x Populus x berolinensis]